MNLAYADHIYLSNLIFEDTSGSRGFILRSWGSYIEIQDCILRGNSTDNILAVVEGAYVKCNQTLTLSNTTETTLTAACLVRDLAVLQFDTSSVSFTGSFSYLISGYHQASITHVSSNMTTEVSCPCFKLSQASYICTSRGDSFVTNSTPGESDSTSGILS